MCRQNSRMEKTMQPSGEIEFLKVWLGIGYRPSASGLPYTCSLTYVSTSQPN